MKGIVFNLLEEVVRREYGADTWETLLDKSDLDGAYTSLGSYPDEEMLRLVQTSSASLGKPADAVLRWFGRMAIPLLARQYPQFFTPHQSTLAFLLTLNQIIHAEVRKLYPGADVPVFEFETPGGAMLRMGYQSKRKLCALAEGFTEGAAAYYGESVSIEQPECMHRGDRRCLLVVSFRKLEA